MKPFDLERALKGAPVMTTHGKQVSQLTLFTEMGDDYCLRGVIGGILHAWTMLGAADKGGPSGWDLRMAPQKVYVNLYKVNAGTKWEVEGPYDAPGHKRAGRNYVARDVEITL